MATVSIVGATASRYRLPEFCAASASLPRIWSGMPRHGTQTSIPSRRSTSTVHQRGLRTPEEIEEERAEAREAHGSGVELVNIFTGERYTT
jgi:hypothetical protein